MKNLYLFVVIVLLSTSNNLKAQFNCGDNVSYEGKEYTTLQIGTQCWIGENLDVGVMITGTTNPSNNGIIQKYCYNDNASNCNTYGAIYKWDEAMNYSVAEGAQGICPVGWHIPSDYEFYVLENYLDPAIDDSLAIGWRGTTAGTILKQGGSSGFDALMAGQKNNVGNYVYINTGTYFWTSTLAPPSMAFYRYLYISNSGVYRSAIVKEYGYSIRCIRNNGGTTENPQSINLINVNVSCYNGTNGSINLVVSGGTSPFTYIWSNGATTQDLNNLTAGTYSVTVADVHNDLSIGSTLITQPENELVATATGTNINCYGNSNGTIDLTITGGISPYHFQWSNDETIQNLTGLSAGIYSVTVIDFNSCAITSCFTVTQPVSALSMSLSSNNVNCYGNSTGWIDISVSGGTSPYSYFWSNNSTSQDLMNIQTGIYSITVTDNNNCKVTSSANITQPASALSSSVTGTNTSCSSLTSGSVDLSVAGGTTPYFYLWSNNAITQDLPAIAAGTYSVTITDFKGCISTSSFTVLPASISVNLGSDIITTIGLSITLNPGFWSTYLWSTGATTQTITVSTTSNYSVTVTSGVCAASDVINVTFNPAAACGDPFAYQGESYPTVQIGSQCWMKKNLNVGNMITGVTNQTNNSIIEKYCYGNNTTNCQTFGGLYQWNEAMQYLTTEGTRGICPVGWHIPANSEWTVLYGGYPTGTAGALISGGSSGFDALFGGLRLASGSFLLLNSFAYFWTSTFYNSTSAYNRSISSSSVYSTNGDKNQGFSIRCIKDTGTVVIDTLSIGTTGTNVNCYGASTGSINLTVTGGVIPYNVIWSNGSTSEDLVNIPAGLYSVTVTDSYGNIKTAIQTITQPSSPLNVTYIITNVGCYGNLTGAIDITVAGGTPPYVYYWSNGSTIQDLTGIAAGTYNVTVTDYNTCITTLSLTVLQPSGALSTSINSVNINCYGSATGSIDLTVTGGTSPYYYIWSNNSTVQDLTNIAAGTYNVTVNDSNNCQVTATKTITQPLAALSTSVTVTNANCTAANTGSVDLSVAGGTSPYTYYWSNTFSGQDLLNVQAGIYTVTVTDNKLCTLTASYNVNAGSISVNLGPDQNLTAGTSFTLDAGNAGATYLWNTSATTQTILVSTSGTYSVTVTSGICTNSDAVLINFFTPVSCSGDVIYEGQTYPVVLVGNQCWLKKNLNVGTMINGTVNQTNNSVIEKYCYSNNTANCTTYGGLYQWTEMMQYTTTEGVKGICPAGWHIPTNTEWTTLISYYSSNSIAASALKSGGSSGYDALFGGSRLADGTFSLSGIIGYYWSSTPSGTSNAFFRAFTSSNVSSNNDLQTKGFSVRCLKDTGSVSLIIDLQGTNILCYGASTGSINLTVNGGATPYTYIWSNSAISEDINNLAAGTYNVTVTDASSVSVTGSKTLTQPASGLSSSFTSVNVNCFGSSTGSVDLTVTGGTSPYTYLWSNSATSQDLLNVPAGVYNVTITDTNGCTVTGTRTVTQPASALSTSFTSVNVNCYGNSTGSVDLTVTGGTSPYTYLWSNSATSQDLLNVPAGIYNVTITDTNGCIVTGTRMVTQPASALSSSFTSVNVNCYGNSTGSVDLTVTGGTSPYIYLWSNSATSQDLLNVPAGIYNVTITDTNGCMVTGTRTVTQPASALSKSFTSVNVNCYGNSTGSVDLTVTGGISPYTYLWSNSATSQDLLNVPAGIYNVTITDTNGCMVTGTRTVTQPASALSKSFTSVNVNCYGNSTGSVDLTVTGGTSPYTYLWSNSATSQDLLNIPAGVYNVTITDINSCTITGLRVITQPASAISTSATSVNVNCYGNSTGSVDLTVTGGTSPYTYLWSNSATSQDLLNVPAGNYTVTISDFNTCQATASKSVTQPLSPLVLSFSVVNALTTLNGSIDLTVTGGTAPYIYAWSNGQITQDVSGLAAGTYSVSVHDANTCISTGSVVVAGSQTYYYQLPYYESFQGSPLDSGWTRQQSAGSSGWLIGASLGSAGWQIPAHTIYAASNDNLCNCAMNADKLISPYIKLTGYTGVSLMFSSYFTGSAGSQGFVLVSIDGGVNWQYVHQMIPQSGTTTWGTTVVNLSGYAGDTVRIAFLHNDNGGWATGFAIDDVHVYGFNASEENIVNWISPTSICETGVAVPITIKVHNVSTVPVTQIYVSYSIDGGQSFVPESAGVSISPSDSTDYTFIQNTVIPNASMVNFIATASYLAGSVFHTDTVYKNISAIPFVVTSTITNPTCSYGSGAVALTATGGEPPVIYDWSDGHTTSAIQNIQPGTYTVTITDGMGCSDILTVVITQPPSMQLDFSATNISCNGASDGSVNLSVTGAVSPLTYSWYKGSVLIGTSEDITGISAGSYVVMVIDANNCFAIDGIDITEPPAILISITATEATQNTPGSATLDITGGVSPYSFFWSNGATTQNVSNLSPGNYYVIVHDASDCISTDNVLIIQTPFYQPEWSFQVTSINHSILIGSSINMTINNNAIQPGDYLGVFYDSLGTLVCAGYIKWMGSTTALTAWGAQSGQHDGFQQGEAFKWKIFDSTNGNIYTALATYLTTGFPDAGYFVTNGLSGLASLSAETVSLQQINLVQGWSMISSYILPVTAGMAPIFNPVISSVDIVKNSLGNVFWPAYNVNLIGNWIVTEGYQVRMTNQALLTLSGTAVLPELTPINLYPGWSIISYLRQNDAAIVSMLSSVVSNVVIVKDGQGNIYWPAYGVNLIGNMLPGKGYQTKISAVTELTYPPNSAALIKEETVLPINQHYLNINITGNNMTVCIPVDALNFSNSINKGDEIGVFSEDGLLSGAGVYQGGNFAVTIWGDDQMSNEKDGLSEGEPFTMKVWNSVTGGESPLIIETWTEGNGFYKPDELVIAGKASVIEQEGNFELYQNNPNPCSDYTVIGFKVPVNCSVELSVSDLPGRKIETVMKKNIIAGSCYITLNTEQYPEGIYLYRLNANGFNMTRILNVVR
jgi:uncharacterized protein (TIGR02145 family)